MCVIACVYELRSFFSQPMIHLFIFIFIIFMTLSPSHSFSLSLFIFCGVVPFYIFRSFGFLVCFRIVRSILRSGQCVLCATSVLACVRLFIFHFIIHERMTKFNAHNKFSRFLCVCVVLRWFFNAFDKKLWWLWAEGRPMLDESSERSGYCTKWYLSRTKTPPIITNHHIEFML